MVLLGFYRFGGSGNRTKLHPKGVKIDTRWPVDPKHASWTLKIDLGAHLGLPRPPKMEFGRLPRAMIGFDLARVITKGSNIFGFGPAYMDLQSIYKQINCAYLTINC